LRPSAVRFTQQQSARIAGQKTRRTVTPKMADCIAVENRPPRGNERRFLVQRKLQNKANFRETEQNTGGTAPCVQERAAKGANACRPQLAWFSESAKHPSV
jgi:hypothetical protein